MLKLTDAHKSVLECYSRPIVHMRKQVEMDRFGLVFGSGLSAGLGIPTWTDLVKALAEDPDVQGASVLAKVPRSAGLPYQTEMLFEHYKQRRYVQAPVTQRYARRLDYKIAANWREIIRKHLYSKIDRPIAKLLADHRYLEQYLPLIRRSHMTVTYNFDDFIEQALLSTRAPKELSSRGFESVTNPWSQFRLTKGIIYHPNGVVPQNPLETPSDRFVFSEASYAKQLMGILAGDQAGLLSHLSKHTCLLIGLSLDDATLRSALMQGARRCPGNYHYYVHFLKPDEPLDDETRMAITLANFKVYKLRTLFLDEAGIRSLGELIDTEGCQRNRFCDFALQHRIKVRFRFYVTGPLGAGKSTAINHFRNLVALDEWMDQRPELLSEDSEKLSDEDREYADGWIAEQFMKKNDYLRNEREGIFIMDRGPLDPLSFTSDNEWASKAARLLKTICPEQATWRVEDGRVIMLLGDSRELALRMVLSQRSHYTAKKLAQMEKRLRNAYDCDGVVTIDTRGQLPSDISRRIAEIIHLDSYEPTCDLHGRLEDIEKDGGNGNA